MAYYWPTIGLLLTLVACGKTDKPDLGLLAGLAGNSTDSTLRIEGGISSAVATTTGYRFVPTAGSEMSAMVDDPTTEHQATVDLITVTTEDGWLLILRTNPDKADVTNDVLLLKGDKIYIPKADCSLQSSSSDSPSASLSECVMASVATSEVDATLATEEIKLTATIVSESSWTEQNVETTTDSSTNNLTTLSKPTEYKAAAYNQNLCDYSKLALLMEAKTALEIKALLTQWWNPLALYAAYLKFGILQFWTTENAKYQSYCW